MKKLVFFLSFVASFFLVLPLSAAVAGDYEYYGYTESLSDQLPSEQSLSEIRQMSDYGKDLRDKPGGGPGLGEMEIPLDSNGANLLALVFMATALMVSKKYKKKS